MKSLIIVKYNNPEHEDEAFRNADVAIAQPGLFIIQSAQGQLAMFPMGEIRGILFPEGDSRITEVTL
jgi:hypothetical protein